MTPAAIASITPWIASSPPTRRRAEDRVEFAVDSDLMTARSFSLPRGQPRHRPNADPHAVSLARASASVRPVPAADRRRARRPECGRSPCRGAVEQVRGGDFVVVYEVCAPRPLQSPSAQSGERWLSSSRRGCSHAQASSTLDRPPLSCPGRRCSACGAEHEQASLRGARPEQRAASTLRISPLEDTIARSSVRAGGR